MGLLDNISGPSTGTAVPGGNVTKPLVIALLALLASRYMSGGPKDTSASASPNTGATSEPDASPSDVLGGLGGLLKQFQQNGFGDAINSWIGTGQNKTVAADQISSALGPDIIDALSQRTGLPKDQILVVLSQVLPNTVDQLTPEGRLPTRQEIERLMG
jgi:uncharacterized protein YidB (DUF937 family)